MLRICRLVLTGLFAGLFVSGCSQNEEPVSQNTSGTITILATGANIAGANGVRIGPDGNLYIASVVGHELLTMNPDSGEILSRLKMSPGAGPDDVAFSGDGTMYWTSFFPGVVGGRKSDGSAISDIALGKDRRGANPVAVSDSGDVFAGQCFLGSGLFQVFPEKDRAPRLITDDLGPGCGLNAMDWGIDADGQGRLYGPRWFNNEVVSIDPDSGDMEVIATGLLVPAAVKFDHEGVLHVLDSLRGQLIRLNPGREPAREVVVDLVPGLDNFDFDQNGRAFISSYVDGFIVRADSDGLHWLSPSGMAHPGGVAVTHHGGISQVVVADLYSVRGFLPGDGSPTFVQRSSIGVTSFLGALTVAPHGDNMILTSWTTTPPSVAIWDPVAQHNVELHTDFEKPVNAIYYAGYLTVAEYASPGRVTGRDSTGQDKVFADTLVAPTGLATDGRSLYVSDRTRGEVLRIAFDGQRVPPEVIAGGIDNPEGLAWSERGLFVVEGESGKILRIEAGATQIIATVSPGSPSPPSDPGPPNPPSYLFNGIAAHGDHLFVTGETNRVLYRIDLN
jgi:sugar lactone lactonase YvrE